MEEIPHHLIGSSSDCLQGFFTSQVVVHPRVKHCHDVLDIVDLFGHIFKFGPHQNWFCTFFVLACDDPVISSQFLIMLFHPCVLPRRTAEICENHRPHTDLLDEKDYLFAPGPSWLCWGPFVFGRRVCDMAERNFSIRIPLLRKWLLQFKDDILYTYDIVCFSIKLALKSTSNINQHHFTTS